MNGEIAEKIGQSRSKRPPISFPFLVEKAETREPILKMNTFFKVRTAESDTDLVVICFQSSSLISFSKNKT